jgi:hypothetical protein
MEGLTPEGVSYRDGDDAVEGIGNGEAEDIGDGESEGIGDGECRRGE